MNKKNMIKLAMINSRVVARSLFANLVQPNVDSPLDHQHGISEFVKTKMFTDVAREVGYLESSTLNYVDSETTGLQYGVFNVYSAIVVVDVVNNDVVSGSVFVCIDDTGKPVCVPVCTGLELSDVVNTLVVMFDRLSFTPPTTLETSALAQEFTEVTVDFPTVVNSAKLGGPRAVASRNSGHKLTVKLAELAIANHHEDDFFADKTYRQLNGRPLQTVPELEKMVNDVQYVVWNDTVDNDIVGHWKCDDLEYIVAYVEHSSGYELVALYLDSKSEIAVHRVDPTLTNCIKKYTDIMYIKAELIHADVIANVSLEVPKEVAEVDWTEVINNYDRRFDGRSCTPTPQQPEDVYDVVNSRVKMDEKHVTELALSNRSLLAYAQRDSTQLEKIYDNRLFNRVNPKCSREVFDTVLADAKLFVERDKIEWHVGRVCSMFAK